MTTTIHGRRCALAIVGLSAVTLFSNGCEPAEGRNSSRSPTIQYSRDGHDRMVSLLAEIADHTDAENEFLSRTRTELARRNLAEAEADAATPPERLWDLLYGTSFQEARLGNERAVIDLLERAVALGDSLPGSISDWKTSNALYRLSVACMRVGETENCCQRPSSESCIFPIQSGGVHERTEGSRRAIGYLTDLVRKVPAPSAMGLKARWLLNLAYMTLGEWPNEVPRRFVLPPELFASDEEFPRFPNVALTLGLDTFDLAGGAIAEDFDADGDLDLMTSTWDTRGPMHYFVNDGAGGFVERTEEAGLHGIVSGLNMVQADYDNDGYADIFVLRGAWLGSAGRHPNSLLHNDGDGTFTDATFEAGLGERAFPTQTAAWRDYDLDGDLDLYVGAESGADLGASFVETAGKGSLREAGQLFRNEGDGTFHDVAKIAGVENLRFAKGVTWGDYDGDRYPDLFISNLGSENRLYRNRGDGTFEDVAQRVGVALPKLSFPAWFWDFDNDGDLDLYVSTFQSGTAALAFVVASYMNLTIRDDREAPRLYRNDGGVFTDVAAEQGVDRESLTMGANFGDLDQDGWLDFYLGTGYPDYEALTPNVMYRNREGTGFSEVTVAGGFAHLQKGHGIVFADLDDDGDQDVFSQLGGAFPGDKYGNALYENPGFGRHWLAVDLVGVRSNRSGLGAHIRVDVVERGVARSIHREVNSGGSFGANPMRQTIGLGMADHIEAVEVHWPVTNERQIFRDVPLDRRIEIEEGASKWRTSTRIAHSTPDEPMSEEFVGTH